MAELLGTKAALLRSDQNVVIGVLACCPPYFGITASELADFGRQLKSAFPRLEFWVALADGGKAPPSFVLPATADCLVIDVLDCDTRAEVEQRAQQVWPKWIEKAAGRRVVLCWDGWQKNGPGLVATCQPGAIRACGEAVDRLNLQGIIFSTYGDNVFAGSRQLGIETRTDLVSEVQTIAQRWCIRAGTEPAGTPTLPTPAQATLPTRLSHVVVVTGEDLAAHRWREMSLALRDVLQADRRLAVEVVQDPNFLADHRLFDYQVAVLNFRNEKPLPQEQRARDNLLKFVGQGHGLMAIHYASGAFATWDRYDELIGKRMNPTPRHDPIGMVAVKVLDTSHPITQGLFDFQVRDELYTSVDGNQSVRTLAVARSIVTGAHYPVAFVGDFGRGRYFHYTLGHSPQAIRSPAAAELLRRAALWLADGAAAASGNAAVSLSNTRSPE